MSAKYAIGTCSSAGGNSVTACGGSFACSFFAVAIASALRPSIACDAHRKCRLCG
jgi:hypothetical protein